jgi:peroxiredoxin
MKKLLIIILVCSFMFANAQTNTLLPGQAAPAFSLKNVDDRQVAFTQFPNAKGFIVNFTCNTCPVALGYEERIMELDKKYAPQGYPVIAINPNDPAVSAGDSFDKMKARAKTKGYTFPYLYDADQKITNLYGAKNTPTVFLVRKTNIGNVVEYTGAIDNDAQNTNPGKKRFLEQAIMDLQANKKPGVASTKAIGCSVRRQTTN